MRKYLLLILFAVSLLMACKRTPFKGDLERFVGLWEWKAAVWEDQGSYETVWLHATDQPYQYRIRITPKGEMILYKDGVELKRMNLKIRDKNCDDTYCMCPIAFENEPDINLGGIIYSNCDGTEGLRFENYGFPYNYQYYETNFFIRIE